MSGPHDFVERIARFVLASIASTGMLAYKVSKAGVNALTHQIAMGNARYGIRCNAILPGLMNTPMAIEGHHAATGCRPRRPGRSAASSCPCAPGGASLPRTDSFHASNVQVPEASHSEVFPGAAHRRTRQGDHSARWEGWPASNPRRTRS